MAERIKGQTFGDSPYWRGFDPVIGDPPCPRCEGTGNEFYRMYKRCTACGGTGRAAAVAEGDDPEEES